MLILALLCDGGKLMTINSLIKRCLCFVCVCGGLTTQSQVLFFIHLDNELKKKIRKG